MAGIGGLDLRGGCRYTVNPAGISVDVMAWYYGISVMQVMQICTQLKATFVLP